MSFDRTGYLSVFLEEVDEQLNMLDEHIILLEQNRDDAKIIQIIFRAAHTLKGSSASMGFERMKGLTHQLEGVFDLIRNKKRNVEVSVINLMLSCIDRLKAMRDSIMNNGTDLVDIHDLLQLFQGYENSTGQTQASRAASIAAAAGPVVDQVHLELIRHARESCLHVWNVFIRLMEDAPMKPVRALLCFNKLNEAGEVIATHPLTEEIEDEAAFQGGITAILLTDKSQSAIVEMLEQISAVHTVTVTEFQENPPPANPMQEAKPQADDQRRAEAAPCKGSSSIRVDTERLDKLMNLVGEIVIDHTRLLEVRKHLAQACGGNEHYSVFNEVLNHLGQALSELQEDMMKTRMLPISQVFQRFPRMMRDMSQKSEKAVDFIMTGQETELDRSLLQEIGDPIIHLLRNAVDHGIEAKEERRATGKAGSGTIRLNACHQDNHIVITISDDGRGMDPERICASAIKKGIITKEEAAYLTPRDQLHLIFRPGFSTAEKVTDISGRGVGMDIVRSHIEKLNGLIEIETEVGKGTTFRMKLPLTLAIIPSLLVNAQDQIFAIPLSNILEISTLQGNPIRTVQNQEVVMLRDQVYPLLLLNECMGLERLEDRVHINSKIVIIGLADKRLALVVDETLGKQDVVAKSLGKLTGTPKHIGGALIMGDGQIALILDIGSLIQDAGTYFEDTRQPSRSDKSNKDVEELHLVTFLVGQEEYGVPIHQIREIVPAPTLTKVVQAPEDVIGVMELRGNVIPVIGMQKRIMNTETVYGLSSRVIVVESVIQEIGLMVDQVNEVIKVQANQLRPATTSRPGIDGCIQQGNRLINVMNVKCYYQLPIYN